MVRLPILFWFLDAGNDETLGRLSWPASKNQNNSGSQREHLKPTVRTRPANLANFALPCHVHTLHSAACATLAKGRFATQTRLRPVCFAS